jgi:hypothetical protein
MLLSAAGRLVGLAKADLLHCKPLHLTTSTQGGFSNFENKFCDALARSECELVHTAGGGISAIGGDMREHVLLFCLLGLVLTATIILVTAPEAVTWALSLVE